MATISALPGIQIKAEDVQRLMNSFYKPKAWVLNKKAIEFAKPIEAAAAKIVQTPLYKTPFLSPWQQHVMDMERAAMVYRIVNPK